MFLINFDNEPNHELARKVIKDKLDRGIRINPEIDKVKSELNLDGLSDTIKKYKVLNPNSNPQIKTAFNRILKEEHVDLTYINDKQTFQKKILYRLSAEGYELADTLLKYRKQKKLAESVNGLISAQRDWLIHPTLTIAKTNRFNYASPALMNIPKEILWKTVVPYNNNTSLYSIDIKQQEPWIIMHMFNIKSLIDLTLEYDDFYRGVYFDIFNILPTSEERDELKTSWNALTYGAGKTSIVDECIKIDGSRIYSYFWKIKELKEHRDNAYHLAKRKTQEIETLFGTKLYTNEEDMNALARSLMDIPIQGMGADILALLIENFIIQNAKNNMENFMDLYYTRHDELLIEVSNTISEKDAIEYLENCFNHQIEDWSPFKLNIKKIGRENNV